MSSISSVALHLISLSNGSVRKIQAAYLLRDKSPPKGVRINDVLRQIASLGGFLMRKGDGEPGVMMIWKGLKKVHIAVKTMRALRRIQPTPTCV
jgi:hypothetical protein